MRLACLRYEKYFDCLMGTAKGEDETEVEVEVEVESHASCHARMQHSA